MELYKDVILQQQRLSFKNKKHWLHIDNWLANRQYLLCIKRVRLDWSWLWGTGRSISWVISLNFLLAKCNLQLKSSLFSSIPLSHLMNFPKVFLTLKHNFSHYTVQLPCFSHRYLMIASDAYPRALITF